MGFRFDCGVTDGLLFANLSFVVTMVLGRVVFTFGEAVALVVVPGFGFDAFFPLAYVLVPGLSLVAADGMAPGFVFGVTLVFASVAKLQFRVDFNFSSEAELAVVVPGAGFDASAADAVGFVMLEADVEVALDLAPGRRAAADLPCNF